MSQHLEDETWRLARAMERLSARVRTLEDQARTEDQARRPPVPCAECDRMRAVVEAARRLIAGEHSIPGLWRDLRDALDALDGRGAR